MTEIDKYKIYAAIANSATVKDLQEQFELSYASAIRYKKQFELAVQEGTVDKLVSMNAAVFNKLKEDFSSAGELSKAAEVEVEKLEASVVGLQRLDVELQVTASAINKQLHKMLVKAEQPSEIESITICLCKLRDAFFNSKSVQVNVQNNIGTRYGDFLNDVPQS